MSRGDSAPSFVVSEETPVKAPLKMFAALVSVVAAGALAWGFTSWTVVNHTVRLEALEKESRDARDVLIRIDERTAEMKRQLDRAVR